MNIFRPIARIIVEFRAAADVSETVAAYISDRRDIFSNDRK